MTCILFRILYSQRKGLVVGMREIIEERERVCVAMVDFGSFWCLKREKSSVCI